MTDLRKLIARCEKAMGPSEEIDAAIGAATGYTPDFFNQLSDFIVPVHLRVSQDGRFVEQWTPDRCVGSRKPFPVTSSIDAAIALVERLLPAWLWSIEKCDRGNFEAWAMAPDYDAGDAKGSCGAATGDTPALALLVAMLRALIAVEEKGRG